MRALQRLSLGAHVVWLDQVLPMYRKDNFAVDAVIGMVKSTNHRFRVVTIFRRADSDVTAETRSGGNQFKQRSFEGLTQPALEAAGAILSHVAD